MHIVMLSDNETKGGAAVAASRLAEGLCTLGHRVTRLVDRPNGYNHVWNLRSLAPSDRHFQLLNIIQRGVGVRFRSRFAALGAWHRLKGALAHLRPDVINVHNLHLAMGSGWSVELLRTCCRYAPTVWTLHDMWSFTGRCAYSYGCHMFIKGCNDSCPTPTEYRRLSPELIAGEWRQRHRLLREYPDLVAVCPSRWLAHNALAGVWAGHRVEVIPYGLPLNTYQPIDRGVARVALDIATKGPVLLTVAHTLTERRKGGEILSEAIQHTSSRPLILITLGHGRLDMRSNTIHVQSLGYIDHERTKVLAYSAADVLVHPAPVDNLPNTVMEAIACGTPVVAFAAGGTPDIIRPGQTGWLADNISPVALARTIDQAIAGLNQGLDLQASCRAVAEAEYSINLQAQRYSELFRSLR